jgi:hypothetical protein
MGADTLSLLGFRAYQAHRATQTFLRHDEESLEHLAEWRGKRDRSGYLSAARQRIEELEQLLLSDLEEEGLDRDAGWDPESLREEFGQTSGD